MAIEFENPVVGGTVLVREDIESQNFVTGVSGWEIRADGSAEFNNVVIRGGIVVGGTALYYDGTPGPNKLIASISAIDGTDPYGNGYSAGISSYNRSLLTYMSMQGGVLYYGTLNSGNAGPDLNAGGVLFAQSNDIASMSSVGSTAPNATLAVESLILGRSGLRTGDNFAPQIQIFGGSHASMADLYVSGSVIQLGMTWQTPLYSAVFAAGSTAGTFQELQYRIDAENNLYITGCFHAIVAGTVTRVFTLPATVGFTKYRPASGQRIGGVVIDNAAGTVNNTASALLEINSTGIVNLRCNPGWSINDNFYISAIIPLGDIQ